MQKIVLINLMIIFAFPVFAQSGTSDLIQSVENESQWKYYNRSPGFIMKDPGKIYCLTLDDKPGDGLAIYQDLEFENGTIEFDVKGKDVAGKSFVGVAFHIQNEETYNAVYFRPFNFNNPDKTKSGHSVQYICHPEFTWSKLRTEFPEQFENPVQAIPDPNEFFHAKLVVKWPMVSVFVEDSTEPSLSVKMKSDFKKGKIGFWVGYGSDGSIKNLIVTKQ
ncbi:MAG TPA: hypothetical protein VLA03_11015 [Draconibacterium sp.]|nr:hypothetical protein [Draconibacterium sp.]